MSLVFSTKWSGVFGLAFVLLGAVTLPGLIVDAGQQPYRSPFDLALHRTAGCWRSPIGQAVDCICSMHRWAE